MKFVNNNKLPRHLVELLKGALILDQWIWCYQQFCTSVSKFFKLPITRRPMKLGNWEMWPEPEFMCPAKNERNKGQRCIMRIIIKYKVLQKEKYKMSLLVNKRRRNNQKDRIYWRQIQTRQINILLHEHIPIKHCIFPFPLRSHFSFLYQLPAPCDL